MPDSLLAIDRALAISGRSILTSAGGAPCCCGDGGCNMPPCTCAQPWCVGRSRLVGTKVEIDGAVVLDATQTVQCCDPDPPLGVVVGTYHRSGIVRRVSSGSPCAPAIAYSESASGSFDAHDFSEWGAPGSYSGTQTDNNCVTTPFSGNTFIYAIESGSYQLAHDFPYGVAPSACLGPVSTRRVRRYTCSTIEEVFLIERGGQFHCSLLFAWRAGLSFSPPCFPTGGVGACCCGGECSDCRTPAECAAAGGTFHGVGSRCINVECQPRGRCCIPQLGCAELSEGDCGFVGGFWTPGDCANPCTLPGGGACCYDLLGTAACQQTSAEHCEQLNGAWFAGQSCAIVCPPCTHTACCHTLLTSHGEERVCYQDLSLSECMALRNPVFSNGAVCGNSTQECSGVICAGGRLSTERIVTPRSGGIRTATGGEVARFGSGCSGCGGQGTTPW